MTEQISNKYRVGADVFDNFDDALGRAWKLAREGGQATVVERFWPESGAWRVVARIPAKVAS